jgi:hypothetical protein
MFFLTVFRVLVLLSLLYQGLIHADDDNMQHIVPMQHIEQQLISLTFAGVIYASQVMKYLRNTTINK